MADLIASLKTKTLKFYRWACEDIDDRVNEFSNKVCQKNVTVEKIETIVSNDMETIFKIISYSCREIL